MALTIPRETHIERASMMRALEYMGLLRCGHPGQGDAEPADWFDEVIPLCEVYDILLMDDTLNGGGVTVTPTLLSPGEATAGNRLYCGGLIRFQALIRHNY